MARAVFLDRDGVLNRAVVRNGRPHSPGSLDEFAIIPGTVEALRALRQAGYLLIVATNQPEVARGLQRKSVIESMHDALRKALPLDDILVCYHDERQGCNCRKPEPGLLIEAARKWGICLDRSYMVGDRWKDIEAGRRAGCRTIRLLHAYNRDEPQQADYAAASIGEAASWILGGREREQDAADGRARKDREAPLVSVMMPAYNAEKYVAQAIESVLAQSCPDWQLVIVDDGSTDRTGAIAAQFRDARITLVRQANGGEAAARNTALGHARGKYLAFLDADDLYLPEHLDACLAFLRGHPQYEGVYSDGFYIDEKGRRLSTLSSRRRGPFCGDIFEQMVRASDVFGAPLCVVLDRQTIAARRFDFDTEIVIGPDWDFLTRYAERAGFGYLDRPTCLYRVHGGSVSARTQQPTRLHSLARCREKAIKLERFAACSPATRAFAFYDLLVNLLAGYPERQTAITRWQEFSGLPAAERARLLRLMASRALLGGEEHPMVGEWLRAARLLNPADRRTRLLSMLFRLNPALCRTLLRLRSPKRACAADPLPFIEPA